MSDLASRITKPEGDVVAAPQDADGAGDVATESNLQQVDYDVEVSLNQLQQDQDHPLGSAKSFEELGL
jgi:ATP-dependent RNA helicase DDX19/DBP5